MEQNNGNANKPGVYVFAGDERTEVTTPTYDLYTVEFTLEESVPVCLGLQAKGNQGNTWCFLSDVKLTYVEGLSTGVDAWPKDACKGLTIQIGCYDLQGRKFNEINRRGIYIINGKKMYKSDKQY